MKNYPHNSHQYMYAFIAESARTVVDVGCNTSAFGEELKRTRAIEILGVEPNANRTKLTNQCLNNTITSLFDRNVPFSDVTFDTVA